MIRPTELRPGDTVAVISPASPPDPILLDRGVRLLQHFGLKVQLGRALNSRHGYLAGSDKIRADDINESISDRTIRAIFCSRGGYGSSRIADMLNFEAFRKDPKIICGFSDITFLLHAIIRKTNTIVFHGPVVASPHFSESNLNPLFHQIMPSLYKNAGEINFTTSGAFGIARAGTCEGILLGGCLSIFCTLIGTPFLPSLKNSILFLEETGESPYRIDRMLCHLRNSGVFSEISGLIVGSFTHCTQRIDDAEPALDITQIFNEILKETDIPVLDGFPGGHGSQNHTLPLGCRFKIDGFRLTQLEPSTSTGPV